MTKARSLMLAALVAAGCNNNSGQGNADMGGDGGVDAGGPAMPSATMVGATGVPAGLQTGGTHAAYLLNPYVAMHGTTAVGTAGELHVTSSTGGDVKVAADVLTGEYLLAPDGSAIFWVGFNFKTGAGNGVSTGAASLNFLSLTTPGATAKVLSASGAVVTNMGQPPINQYQPYPLAALSSFSPSSKYFATGVASSPDVTPDLVVFDTAAGSQVYKEPNGGASVYARVMLPDETMIFANTANGTSVSSPPLQTLYYTKLGGGAATTAITTRAATFVPTVDNKTLVILETSGDLVTWSVGGAAPSATPLASGAAVFALGGDATGPIAWVGADKSLHVVTTDGNKKLDLAGNVANADVLGTPVLSDDGKDVYYWQKVEQQNNRGTLMHVALGGGTPAKVADAVSLVDFQLAGSTLLFEQGVDDVGQLGGAAFAARDGSNLKALGSNAAVGGLRVTSGSGGWRALHLDGAANAPGNKPIDDSAAITGMLALDDSTGNETMLDNSVHTGSFGFSPGGEAAIYVAGATWSTAAQNYVGALTFVNLSAPTVKVDGKVAGVSELGPIGNRQFFVSAPAATPAGVYFVSF